MLNSSQHLARRLTTQSIRSSRAPSWRRQSCAWMSDSTSDKPPNDDETDDGEFAEWIPPDRELAGDKGQSHLYKKKNDAAPDWLATRRQALDKPDKNRRYAGAELEVKPGVLLSGTEIETCLTSMGGVDCKIVETRSHTNVEGMIIVTGTSEQHLALLTDTLVRQLKVRKLADYGVQGARLGAEAGSDWNVIDCRNYVVHVLLQETRQQLNLEALWTGDDDMFKMGYNDEDAVDDYVAANPVPDAFGVVEDHDVPSAVSKLQRWNLGHKAVVRPSGKKRATLRRTSHDPRLL